VYLVRLAADTLLLAMSGDSPSARGLDPACRCTMSSVRDHRVRWVMTTFDPDTVVQAPKVPGHIAPAPHPEDPASSSD
jgi:hypothetical protein